MRLLLLELLRLGALALLAAGLSGLLAEPLSRRTGMDHFTGDDRALVAGLSVERCAQLVKLHRGQRTCAGALVEDHFGELVQGGLVAVVAAGVLLVLLRRLAMPPVGRSEELVEAILLTAAALLFAALATTDLPAGVAGLRGLEPGSGRALLHGGVAALFAAGLGAPAVGWWRRLAGA